MPEIRTRLAELCRAHEIAPDLKQELEQIDRELRDMQDRTEQLQRQLSGTTTGLQGDGIDAEKLSEVFESLSRLCHRINNPLTSIMGRSQMLQLKSPMKDDDQLTKSLGVIDESTKRMAALIQELSNTVCQARKEFVADRGEGRRSDRC